MPGKMATDTSSAMILLRRLPIYKQHKLLVENGLIMAERKTMYGKNFSADKQRVAQYAAGNRDYCQRLCDAVNIAIEKQREADRSAAKHRMERRHLKAAAQVSKRMQAGTT